jgi:hypothetical protein
MLKKPLSRVQQDYIKALGLDGKIFTTIHSPP